MREGETRASSEQRQLQLQPLEPPDTLVMEYAMNGRRGRVQILHPASALTRSIAAFGSPSHARDALQVVFAMSYSIRWAIPQNAELKGVLQFNASQYRVRSTIRLKGKGCNGRPCVRGG